MKSRIALIILSLSLLSSTAQAAEPRLTEQSIRNFYKDSKAILKKSFTDYSAYTDKHTAPDIEVTVNDESIADNQAPQKQSITLDRQKLMDGLQNNYDLGKQTTQDYKIESIQISPDGKSATVNNKTSISGTMSAPNGDGILGVTIASKADCIDTVIIGTNSEIQTSKSVCNSKTKLTFNKSKKN